MAIAAAEGISGGFPICNKLEAEISELEADEILEFSYGYGNARAWPLIVLFALAITCWAYRPTSPPGLKKCAPWTIPVGRNRT